MYSSLFLRRRFGVLLGPVVHLELPVALPVTASAEEVSIAVPAAQRGILVANGAPGQFLVVVVGHASLCVSQDWPHSAYAFIVRALIS